MFQVESSVWEDLRDCDERNWVSDGDADTAWWLQIIGNDSFYVSSKDISWNFKNLPSIDLKKFAVSLPNLLHLSTTVLASVAYIWNVRVVAMYWSWNPLIHRCGFITCHYVMTSEHSILLFQTASVLQATFKPAFYPFYLEYLDKMLQMLLNWCQCNAFCLTGISNISGEAKKSLPSFWIPQLTPAATKTKVKKPSSKVRDPLTMLTRIL